MVSPGLVELTGIPAGRYNLDLNGPVAALRMNGVDLNKDGHPDIACIDSTRLKWYENAPAR